MIGKQNTRSEALILNELTVRDIWNNSRASTQSARLGKEPPWALRRDVQQQRGWGLTDFQPSDPVLCVL